MNTFLIIAALAGLVIAVQALKAPKARKVRVPAANPSRKRKPQHDDQ